jgi:hypothetical protein
MVHATNNYVEPLILLRIGETKDEKNETYRSPHGYRYKHNSDRSKLATCGDQVPVQQIHNAEFRITWAHSANRYRHRNSGIACDLEKTREEETEAPTSRLSLPCLTPVN